MSVKVDREERPDVDAVYMAATQAMTGPGRLADDRVPDPGPGAVLLRHLLPAATPAARHAGRSRRGARQAVAGAGSSGRDDGRRRTGERTAGRWRERRVTAGAAAIGAAEAWPTLRQAAVVGLAAGLRRGPRRLRRGAQVPAVDGAGVPAAARRARRAGDAHGRAGRWPRGRCEAMARGGIYDQLGGGFARYSVDARLGRAALREDALRQRPAGPGLRALWRLTGDELAPAGGRGDLRLDDGRAAAPPRAASPRRWTPTARARRARSTSGRPAELTEVLGPDDGACAAELFGVTAAGTFEHGASVAAAAAPTRHDAGALRPRSAPRCSRPGRAGSGPAGTTRSSRPGTAWPSRRWPRPGCCSAEPGFVDAARDAADAAGRRAPGRTAGCARTSRDGVAGRQRRGAGGLRQRRRRPPRPVRGDRRGALGRRCAGQLLETALDRFARRRRRLLRHRRRRRAADLPPRRPRRRTPARRAPSPWPGRCSATPR